MSAMFSAIIFAFPFAAFLKMEDSSLVKTSFFILVEISKLLLVGFFRIMIMYFRFICSRGKDRIDRKKKK